MTETKTTNTETQDEPCQVCGCQPKTENGIVMCLPSTCGGIVCRECAGPKKWAEYLEWCEELAL